MRVLVVGGGGREHAIVWKLRQSPLVDRICCAPGNAGVARIAECVPLASTDLEGLAGFASRERIDLTVVGPELALIAGIVDRFEALGLPVFGPAAGPARIEGSKVFAKQLMQHSGIPTADFWICDSLSEARARVDDFYRTAAPEARLVVKADGLAAGKGVTVACGEEEAHQALTRIMEERVFGVSGDRVVLEECLTGEEVSLLAITDGVAIVPLLPAQDHKRILDGDEGPNTGGMGACAPVPQLPPERVPEAVARVLRPAVSALGALGTPYRGILYAGLMLTPNGLKTIEFNCRFGDPETQAILPLLESDLAALFLSVLNGTIASAEVRWRSGAAVCAVAASEGYPGACAVGREIAGLEEAEQRDDCIVFHSGTRIEGGRILTDGGRVLGVTGVGGSLAEASAAAYRGLEGIRFAGMHYRRDIGRRAQAAEIRSGRRMQLGEDVR